MVMSWQILGVLLAAVVYGVPAVAFLLGALLLIVEGESWVLSMMGLGICVVGLVVALIGFMVSMPVG